MSHGILLQKSCVANDVVAYNRFAMTSSSVDIDNGNVFRLDTQNLYNSSGSSGYSEVWDVLAPAITGSNMDGLWMANQESPNKTVDGSYEYRGLNDDPRNFYNVGGDVFSAFKPQVGDIVELSADNFVNTFSTNVYAHSGSSVYTLYWSDTAATGSRMSFRYLATTYFSIGTGALDDQRETAYKLECVDN